MVRVPIGWLQLKQEKVRFAAALCGVGFAVTLIFMQLGFQYALFKSSVRYHEALLYDLVLLNPESAYIARTRPFTERRLYQSLAAEGVESVEGIYLQLGQWKNPFGDDSRDVFVVGFDPASRVLDLPLGPAGSLIRRRDAFLFDRASRSEFGPVAARLDSRRSLLTEVNHREVEIVGLFELGTSFGIDGSLLTSDRNFLRVFGDREPGLIDLGLIRLRPGADAEAVRAELRSALAEDVLVLTRGEYQAREIDYWARSTPIGYVSTFGVVVGLLVGGVVVYQILFADVNDHLSEYATLKAMGYSSLSLSAIVVQQALILAVLGFVPGLLACLWLYQLAGAATQLPVVMTPERALSVLGLTVAMSTLAAVAALRKVRAADPAEIF